MKKNGKIIWLSAMLLLSMTGCSGNSSRLQSEEAVIESEVSSAMPTKIPETTAETATSIKTEIKIPDGKETDAAIAGQPHPMDDYPRVDGSTATIPLSEQYAADMMGVPIEEARLYIYHNRTHEAYINLIEGNADIIFVTAPSEVVQQQARSAGVELEIIPVVTEGFVFLVNRQNPVRDLTRQEVVGIYSGSITNWSEVGGQDQEIIPYQRPDNSGSQSGMLELVMGETPLMKAPEQYLLSYMGELVDAVAAYETGKNGIGYSYYYYAATMYEKEDVDFLAVDGIIPGRETIQNGSYPYTTSYYAVIRKDEPETSKARILLEWIKENGDTSAIKAGYIPTK